MLLVQCSRDYTRVWLSGNRDHWGPLWRLATSALWFLAFTSLPRAKYTHHPHPHPPQDPEVLPHYSISCISSSKSSPGADKAPLVQFLQYMKGSSWPVKQRDELSDHRPAPLHTQYTLWERHKIAIQKGGKWSIAILKSCQADGMIHHGSWLSLLSSWFWPLCHPSFFMKANMCLQLSGFLACFLPVEFWESKGLFSFCVVSVVYENT